jgi:hypothetical protein
MEANRERTEVNLKGMFVYLGRMFASLERR